MNIDSTFTPITTRVPTEGTDSTVDKTTTQMLRVLSRHIPGGYSSLPTAGELTHADAAEFLDLIAQVMRMWSSAAVEAETTRDHLQMDINTVRRVLGTAL